GELLGALDFAIGPVREVTNVGRRGAVDTAELLRAAYRRFQPNRIVLGRAPDDRESAQLSPLFEERDQREGRAPAYVCEGYTCGRPATSAEELAAQLSG